MGQVVLPFDIEGTDTKDIGQVMANLQAIVDEVNGSLVASVNVAVAAAVTQDGNANAAGSSASLARADHTHMIQGVERRATAPSSGHFVGRLYFDTVTERLMLCTDAGGTYIEIVALESGNEGAMVYVDGGVPVWTAAPTAGQILRSVADVPTWMTEARARVTHSTAQTIADVTTVALAFNTEREDLLGFHDTATNNSRLTVPAGQGGFYIIGGSVEFAADADGRRDLTIRVGGSTVIAENRLPSPGTGLARMSIVTGWPLSATDYVELVVTHGAGNNLDVNKAEAYSPEFWIARVA